MLKRYGTDENGNVVEKAVVYTAHEHKIDHSKIDKDAVAIINRLCEAGFHSYIVGGAVRDLLCDNIPKDFDIVTTATPNRITRLFRNSRIIGRRFRIVHIMCGTKIFEVTTFRSMNKGSTIGNTYGSIEEDVMRRDFTINALYYDVINDLVIDYVGGVRDIKKHLLRNIISLERIFSEDPVRMIRAIRYAAKTQSKIPFALRHKIKSSCHLLEDISKSRLTEEFSKIINSGHAYEIILDALDTGLFDVLQPNVKSLIDRDKEFAQKYFDSLKDLDNLVNNTNKSSKGAGARLSYLLKDYANNVISDMTANGDTIEKAIDRVFLTVESPSLDKKRRKKSQTLYSSSYNRLFEYMWLCCHRFIAPLTPQRYEFESALKIILSKVNLKKNKK